MIESKSFTNPFPGLRPFETDEYRLFFGREGQSDSLITRLQRSRFLAVVGTSGSGKSSLVRAGLLPALRGGMMAGAGSGWRICIMRPGSDPIGNLALALADKDVLLEAGAGLPPAEAEAVIEATLRRGSLGLVEVAKQARLAAPEKLLVVVDQFEELFRFRAARASSSTGDDASAFVKLLLEAAQQSELSIYVVPTMRSDFLGDCAQFQGLPEAINDGQYLIPRMTRDERRFAITGPVGVTRGKITEPLVNRLMNDVGDNPDQLPILQHALMRTWDYWAMHRRNREPIGLEYYEAVGTMSDALSKHADEAFDELPDERSRQIAEVLFKSLTERGADNREIRRPTCLKDICDIANATALEVGAVIEVFRAPGRSFLMPPAGVALRPETVIDISHESLIRNWDRLKAWVRDEADSARIYRRLAGSATDYYQGAGGLLDDVTLQYVLTWRERTKPEWAWGVRYHPDFNTAMTYLDLSTASRDARIEAEQERERKELETAHAFAEKQARSAKRLRWLTAGMAVMFVLALAAAGYAVVAKRGAEKDRARVADAFELADKQRKELVDTLKKKDEADKGRAVAEVGKQRAQAAEKEALSNALIAKARAEAEAKRANTQAAIAAKNLRDTLEATTAASSIVRRAFPIVSQGSLLLRGSEASRRAELDKALDYFSQLRDQLEKLGPGSSAQPAQPNLTIEKLQEYAKTIGQYEQFSMQRGWTLSNIGSIYLRKGDPAEAIKNYEQALRVLKTVAESDSDPITFETYLGLAEAYHEAAVNARSNRSENFKESEKYLQLALGFQQGALVQESWVVADTHLKLAQLYVDSNDVDKAEASFKRAVEGRRRGRQGNELNTNERAGLTAALRELGKFYTDQSNFPAAAQTYNELIDIQDKEVSVYDVPGLNGLTDSYSELAQVYGASAQKHENAQEHKSAQIDEARSTKTFKVAGLVQYVALASRKYQLNKDSEKSVLELAYQLDQLGDAYLQLDRFAQAEETYNTALGFRNGTRAGEAWRSYERLGNMFYDQIKDKDYAKNFGNKDYAEAYDKAKEHYSALVSFFEPPPTADVLKDKFGEGLERLARLEANDPSTYDAAERNLTTALGIRRQRADWKGEFSTLAALVDLYRREKKQPKIDETYETWLASMNKYIKLYANPNPSRAWTGFLGAYMHAVAEIGESYLSRKMNAQAETVYAQAFAYSPLIRGRSFDPKVLEMYATALEKYEALLRELNKPAEAAKVKPDIESVRGKLEVERTRQLQQQSQQAPVQQPKEPQ